MSNSLNPGFLPTRVQNALRGLFLYHRAIPSLINTNFFSSTSIAIANLQPLSHGSRTEDSVRGGPQ